MGKLVISGYKQGLRENNYINMQVLATPALSVRSYFCPLVMHAEVFWGKGHNISASFSGSGWTCLYLDGRGQKPNMTQGSEPVGGFREFFVPFL